MESGLWKQQWMGRQEWKNWPFCLLPRTNIIVGWYWKLSVKWRVYQLYDTIDKPFTIDTICINGIVDPNRKYIQLLILVIFEEMIDAISDGQDK